MKTIIIIFVSLILAGATAFEQVQIHQLKADVAGLQQQVILKSACPVSKSTPIQHLILNKGDSVLVQDTATASHAAPPCNDKAKIGSTQPAKKIEAVKASRYDQSDYHPYQSSGPQH